MTLACVLLEDAHLQPVGLTSKTSFKRKTEFEHCTTFLDNPDALYRFVSKLTQDMRSQLELFHHKKISLKILDTFSSLLFSLH